MAPEVQPTVPGALDHQVVRATFEILAANTRRGMLRSLLGVPLFGAALAQQGSMPGCFATASHPPWCWS